MKQNKKQTKKTFILVCFIGIKEFRIRFALFEHKNTLIIVVIENPSFQVRAAYLAIYDPENRDVLLI
jgi:hypothetical protein